MISLIALKSLFKKAEKISDLKENIDLIIHKTPYVVDSFESYYAAYKLDGDIEGFPVAARDLYSQATNAEDKETLREWFSVSQSIDSFQDKGFIKPQDLEGISFKGALGILQQALENLTQREDEDEEQEEQHEQRQKR